MNEMDRLMRRMSRGEQEPEALDHELESAKICTPKGISIAHKFLAEDSYDPEYNRWYNDRFLERSSLAQEAKQEGRWADFIKNHEVNFYPHALEEISAIAPRLEWAITFREAWYLSKEIMINADRWRLLLEKVGALLMTDQERAHLANSPETFQVYRGCSKAQDLGLSWSRDHEWAKYFARECHGVVIGGTVNKSDVFAYLNINQEEQEIIVLPENVTDVSCLGRWFD